MTTERVLIVDDDESVRWVLKKSLEKEGIETTLAKSASEALEQIQEGEGTTFSIYLPLAG